MNTAAIVGKAKRFQPQRVRVAIATAYTMWTQCGAASVRASAGRIRSRMRIAWSAALALTAYTRKFTGAGMMAQTCGIAFGRVRTSP